MSGGTPLELTNVQPSDLTWISRVVGLWQRSGRWSFALGATPSPTKLSRLLWDDVPTQQVAREDGAVFALLQLARPELDDGIAKLELLLAPDRFSDLDPLIGEFVARMFHEYPLRKLCMTAAADELELPPCLRATVRWAGCLTDHRHRGGSRYVDWNVYEIWRHAWFGSESGDEAS